MKQHISRKAIFGFAIILTVSAIAWQTNPTTPGQNNNDTIPERNRKVRNIDDALEQIENANVEIDKTLKNQDWEKIKIDIKESIKNLHINEADIKAQIANSLKQVDAAKIQADVQKAMSKIELAQVNKELLYSFNEADRAAIKDEVAKALKEVDIEKIKAEVAQSVAKIDWENMRSDMDEVKKIDLEKIEEDLKNIKPEIERSIKDAHASIEDAKKELLLYKNLIDELDKDGLINKKERYTIEYKNNELIINGRKQPAGVLNKYNDILMGHKNFTITSDQNNFNIKND